MHNYWLSSNTAGRDAKKTEVTNVILLKSSTILESINTSHCDRRALTANTSVQVRCLKLNTDKWEGKSHMRATTTIRSLREWPTRGHQENQFCLGQQLDWEGSDMLIAFTYMKDCYEEDGNFFPLFLSLLCRQVKNSGLIHSKRFLGSYKKKNIVRQLRMAKDTLQNLLSQ